jgi:hypothetical protein
MQHDEQRGDMGLCFGERPDEVSDEEPAEAGRQARCLLAVIPISLDFNCHLLFPFEVKDSCKM